MNGEIITIERHILEQQRAHPEATGVFTNLLYDIALAAKIIAREVSRAGLVQILGRAGTVNVQGEAQMKLDVFANQTIIRMNSYTGRLAVMASEEEPHIIPIPEGYPTGRYVLVFDPLDGSSNIDVNASIGTIFGIYRRKTSGGPGTVEDCLQPGRDLVAAGYVIYGSSTMLVYTTGSGVHGFTLDPSVGEFLLSHPNIRIPTEPKYYSANQGNERYWSEGVRRYTRWLQGLDEEIRGNPSRHATSAPLSPISTAICWRAESSIILWTIRTPVSPKGNSGCSTRRPPWLSSLITLEGMRPTAAAPSWRLSRSPSISGLHSSSATGTW